MSNHDVEGLLGELCAQAFRYAMENGLLDTEYKTADYGIAIGFASESHELQGLLSYVVVNRVTGVIEASSAVLPQALSALRQLQGHMDEAKKDWPALHDAFTVKQ